MQLIQAKNGKDYQAYQSFFLALISIPLSRTYIHVWNPG